MSKNPNIEYSEFLDYFIEDLDSSILEKINLNLIFLIGEIGKLATISDKYLDFLIKTYYSSDRWIRDEIIQSIRKISKTTTFGEEITRLVGNGINDDYLPIRINALKTVLNLDEIPQFIYRNVFLALNSKDKELKTACADILKKHLSGYNQLFKLLENLENYKVLKPYAIRSLLLMIFNSPFNLEPFLNNISDSDWEREYKELFIKEIEIYERILLKNI
ncbi:MAG: hypothetical protein ACFE9Z_05650 [Promethearchaeota archaeon]